ncbi:hypothetical protein KFL_003030010, partial [Klebsormidium nitens]
EPIEDKGLAAYSSAEFAVFLAGADPTEVDLQDDRILLDGERANQDLLVGRLKEFYEAQAGARTGASHVAWWAGFSALLEAVVSRRVTRVLKWVDAKLTEFRDEDGTLNEAAARFRAEAEAKARELQARCPDEAEWRLCKARCDHCFLGCLSIKNQEVQVHSCMGSHKCDSAGAYCVDDGAAEQNACGERNGHAGVHDCRVKDHTCGAACHLAHCLNCNKVCARKSGHARDAPHLCNAPAHMCGAPCTAPRCQGRCNISIGKQHTVHKCPEVACTHQCVLPNCAQSCAARDHFHGSALSRTFLEENAIAPDAAEEARFQGAHFCGQPHACSEKCEMDGICKVSIQEVKEETEIFQGKLSTFEYRAVSEANGERRDCCERIPPFQTEHSGVHRHTTDPRVVQYCDKRCPTCWYFCELEYGHNGLHKGAHGMMRRSFFVADAEEIDLGGGRVYAPGESGRAEMCDMFCRSTGRGHIHIMDCDSADPLRCTHAAEDGRRHQTRVYLPNGHVPKDELTHAAYWDTVGWEDSCSAADRAEFARCGYACGHPAHCAPGAAKSQCVMPLWHRPVTETASTRNALAIQGDPGVVSSDGHVYNCSPAHPLASGDNYHVVLVLDSSYSMNGAPWAQLKAAVSAFVQTRLAKSSADVLSIALFDASARIVCEAQPFSAQPQTALPAQATGADTRFSPALSTTFEVLQRVRARGSAVSAFRFGVSAFRSGQVVYTPLVLFMSDGCGSGGSAEMDAIYRAFSGDKLEVHTVAFGNANKDQLRSLANRAQRHFHESVDGVALKDTFVRISSQMKVHVSLVAQPTGARAAQANGPAANAREIERVNSFRQQQEKAAEDDAERERLGEAARAEIAPVKEAADGSLLDLLRRLGIPVGGGERPSRSDLKKAKAAANRMFHPNTAGNAQKSLWDRVYGEEVIKELQNHPDWNAL